MDLILWRHAEAEEGSDDLARALTRRGQQQANRMAAWLRPRLPRDYVLLASEAKRSQQTAAFLSKGYGILPDFNPDRSAEEILKAISWPTPGKTIVLVGHQPWMGFMASRLMSGENQLWSIKKGAIWWLAHRQRHEIEQVRLKVMLTPSMLD